MKWHAVKIRFDADAPHTAAELLAEAFRGIGVEGVVIDDPTLTPEEGWGADALPKPDRHAVTGYLPDTTGFNSRLSSLVASVNRLERVLGIRCRLTTDAIGEEDWAESWKAYFGPERIGRCIVVKPTWRDYTAAATDRVIEIDPGMAFGTGTHPTTALCIRALEDVLRPGDTIADVGTGSGILLIAAALLGAGAGAGVDTDPVAVTVARENLARNHVPADRFSVSEGSAAALPPTGYDLLTANILSEIIIALLGGMAPRLKPGGTAIFSGIITENAPAVLAALPPHGLDAADVREADGWVCILARRRLRETGP